MPLSKNRGLILSSLAIFSLLFLCIILKSSPSPDTLLANHLPNQYEEIIKQKESWRQILRRTDSKLFYEVLKENYSNNENKHIVGHLFGDLLYDKEGLAGMDICDSNLYWGCYHALTSKAISKEGLSIIPQLNCPLCAHGIGHGLSEYFGPNQLILALNECDNVFPSQNCYMGVFMQYNFPVDLDKENTVAEYRPLLQGKEYSPCGDFPEKYDQSCYFELPRWWQAVTSSDFTVIVKYCSKIKTKIFRESCFSGVGEIASVTGDNQPNSTVVICQSILDYSSRNVCLVAASRRFNSESGGQDKSSFVCDAASKEYQVQCRI